MDIIKIPSKRLAISILLNIEVSLLSTLCFEKNKIVNNNEQRKPHIGMYKLVIILTIKIIAKKEIYYNIPLFSL